MIYIGTASLNFFPAIERVAGDSLSGRIPPAVFLVGMFFGFGIGLDRVAMRANEFLSPFHKPIGSLEQSSRLVIQSVKTLSTSLTKIFPRFLSPPRRQQQRTDSPESHTDYEGREP